MKCSRKTEDRVRRIVGYTLLVLLSCLYVVLWYFLPISMAGLHLCLLAAVIVILGVEWLSGDINLCDKD